MGKIIKRGVPYGGSSNSAGNISYDNSASDLNSLTVQNAITELDGLVREKLTQYSVMPTASAEYVGKVVQYVGESDSNYKQGWNYVAVSDGAEPPAYSWQALMDTVPTQGSNNPVTSDGIYKRTPFKRSTTGNSAVLGYGSFVNGGGLENSIVAANASSAVAKNSAAIGGTSLLANNTNSLVCGIANKPRTGDLFNIGNGADYNHRSNIVEVNHTSANVNGDIQQNGVPIRATTMPTITSNMLGKVVQYVGETTNDYVKGYFYVASSDGAAEPTYSWENISVSSEPERITAEELSAMWEV